MTHKGVGADCVGFVCGLLDELLDLEPEERPRIPQDATLHAEGANLKVVMYFKRRYKPLTRLHPKGCTFIVGPGDLVLSKVGKGANHIYVVGTEKNTCWHCWEGSGVSRASLSTMMAPIEAYRPERLTWQ